MQIIRPEDRKRRRLSYWLLMGGSTAAPRTLVADGAINAPLVLSRAQAAGVEATAQIDLRLTLVALNAISAPLVFSRAQAAGVEATGDV